MGKFMIADEIFLPLTWNVGCCVIALAQF